jgi:hypothetical protein
MVKKGIYLLAGIVAAYAALAATHKGEFYPFSIYPMFSQAGRPWNHSLVRDITHDSSAINWDNKTQKELPGSSFALNKVGISQNDLTAYIDKNDRWNKRQIKGLRTYFRQALKHKTDLLVFKVHGQLTDGRSQRDTVKYIPFILIRRDTTIINPKISKAHTAKAGL